MGPARLPRARGSSPFVCVSAGPVRGCGRDKRAAQPVASGKPGQVCGGPDSRGPQKHRPERTLGKKTRSCF